MLDEEMLGMIKQEYPMASLEKLWNFFLLFSEEENISIESFEKIKSEVRYGYDIKFDIYAYINGKIKTSVDSTGQIAIFGVKKYLLSDLYTEIEKRSMAIKVFLTKATFVDDGRKILPEDIKTLKK